ncbi:hypothetical protein N7501_005566 [Penicillium viridicatum]|nr:hypothetical protein N7501_005566 [Penicillium viridicatum]
MKVSNIPMRDSKQLILTRGLVQAVESMATIRVRAKQIIQAPLPPSKVGALRTASSALHNLEYVGTLTPWPNSKSSVQAMYNAQVFSRSSTAAVSPGLHNVDPEIVCVGDEHGLQGRFQQAIGQALRYKNVPDIVGLSTTVQGREELRLIGELKVPWVVPEHSLYRASLNG